MGRMRRWWQQREDRVRSYEFRVRTAVTFMLVPVSCSAIMVMLALAQVGASHGRVATELADELEVLSTLRTNLNRASHVVEDYASTGTEDTRVEFEQLAGAIERDLGRVVEFDEAEEVRLGRAANVAWAAAQDDTAEVFSAAEHSDLHVQAHTVAGQLAVAARWISELDAVSRGEVIASSAAAARTSRLVVTLAVIIGVIATAINMRMIRRLFNATFGPLRHLTDSVRRFSADDLGRRIELTGDREFRAVAESFNVMADRLSDTFESLEHQAFHDALTGLPNRAGLLRHLRNAATRDRSIILFDLDDFKEVNDGLGHAAGDEALFHLARRLIRSVRSDDFVARLGGDEFVVALDGVALDDAATIGGNLAREIARPFDIGGRPVVLHASVGVAPVRRDDAPVDALRTADVALYAAKAAGKQCVRVFSDEMLHGVEAHLEMATDLRHALDRGQIAVHYQPTIMTETGAVHSVEALMRWTHPERGAVPPGTFIPVAEATGAIVVLGRYVLDTACRQAKAWQQLPGLEHLSVNVNVSAVQLQTTEIVADVARALHESGLSPHSLTIEVTESVVACADSVERIHEIKALGVGIALDDFGTGYSSLSYLQRLPIDVLKIDKTFIDDIDVRADRAVLASSIVRLGHSLGMVTVAEGVERHEQLRALGTAGCDVIQGYLFARPQPAHEAEQRMLELTRSSATTPVSAGPRSVHISAGPFDIVGAREWLDHAHWALDEVEAGRLVPEGLSPAVVALMRDFVHRWSLAALDDDVFVWEADEDAELLGILMSQWRRVSCALVDAVAEGTVTISVQAATFSQSLVHTILVALAEHEGGDRSRPAVLAQRWPNRLPSSTSTEAN